jgi:electron transfer flavoprotein beta subunit
MDIIVCVKRVPDTSEADVIIAKDGRTVEAGDLVFDINEWDKYAVEEAVQLKEKYGGTVTALTLGPDEAEDTLRRCFATGADKAIRLTDSAFEGSDAAAIAKIVHRAVKDLKFDLIFTGTQASDDGYGQVGPVLASLLGLPHASVVTQVDIDDGKARVQRELEGGMSEVVELTLPSVLTIQTGINEPRYVSIMGVRKAAGKEIATFGLADLGLTAEDTGETGSLTKVERLFVPPVTKEAEIIQGSPDEAATRLAQIIKDKGGLS